MFNIFMWLIRFSGFAFFFQVQQAVPLPWLYTIRCTQHESELKIKSVYLLHCAVMFTDPHVLQNDQRFLTGIPHTLLQNVTAKWETQTKDWSAYSNGEFMRISHAALPVENGIKNGFLPSGWPHVDSGGVLI